VTDRLDLDRYCARIDYAGPRAPTLAVLRELVARHCAAIAFENIDVLARRPIRLDVASLQDKLLVRRRGGYCHEQNLLLLAALQALGFQAVGLAAHVRFRLPPAVAMPRTHALLLVTLPEGPHVADVGFGRLTPTAPLALNTEDAQPTPLETFRIRPIDDEHVLEAHLDGAWTEVYRFALLRQRLIDYQAATWYTSTAPGGLFVRNLVVTRPHPTGRLTLFNHRLTTTRRGTPSEVRVLRTRADFRTVLTEAFDLALVDDDLAAVMAALAAHDSDAAPAAPFA
jgi:N-hydroxyarylamine O-acetyltransferase